MNDLLENVGLLNKNIGYIIYHARNKLVNLISYVYLSCVVKYLYQQFKTGDLPILQLVKTKLKTMNVGDINEETKYLKKLESSPKLLKEFVDGKKIITGYMMGGTVTESHLKEFIAFFHSSRFMKIYIKDNTV